jgi:hypothetical protein
MRTGLLVTLLLVVSAVVFSLSAKSVEEISVPYTPATISGCLHGNPDSYTLTERDGTVHYLMGQSDALSSHVGHKVQLQGLKDDDRDASASGDEGTPHGLRFFSVEQIVSDSGTCK